MNHQESLFSPTAIFHYFMMPVWPWISLEREIYWIWIPRTSSSQCNNKSVLVPPLKPTDPVKDTYDGQTYDLKTRVDIFMRMDVVPMEYGILTQIFHLAMWLFQFITRITFNCYYALWCIIDLLVWIGIWTKLRIYKVPSYPFRWSCRSFGSLWRPFTIIWMLGSSKNLKHI